jgi:hypothetical protein
MKIVNLFQKVIILTVLVIATSAKFHNSLAEVNRGYMNDLNFEISSFQVNDDSITFRINKDEVQVDGSDDGVARIPLSWISEMRIVNDMLLIYHTNGEDVLSLELEGSSDGYKVVTEIYINFLISALKRLEAMEGGTDDSTDGSEAREALVYSIQSVYYKSQDLLAIFNKEDTIEEVINELNNLKQEGVLEVFRYQWNEAKIREERANTRKEKLEEYYQNDEAKSRGPLKKSLSLSGMLKASGLSHSKKKIHSNEELLIKSTSKEQLLQDKSSKFGSVSRFMKGLPSVLPQSNKAKKYKDEVHGKRKISKSNP